MDRLVLPDSPPEKRESKKGSFMKNFCKAYLTPLFGNLSQAQGFIERTPPPRVKAKQRRESRILAVFGVLMALSLALFLGCADPEPPPATDYGNEDTPIALTMGSWYDDNLDAYGREWWYYFNAEQGRSYTISQKDSISDRGAYTADIIVYAKYQGNDNFIFGTEEYSRTFTAAKDGRVLLRVKASPIALVGLRGTFAIRVSTVPGTPQSVTITGIDATHNGKPARLLLEGTKNYYGVENIAGGSVTMILVNKADDEMATGTAANGTYKATLIIYNNETDQAAGNYAYAGIAASTAISGATNEKAFTSFTDASLGAVTIRVNNGVQTATKVGVELTADHRNGPSSIGISWQWNLNGVPIENNGTGETYRPLGPGIYSVTASADNYVSKTSAIVTVTDADVVPGQQKVTVTGLGDYNGDIVALTLFRDIANHTPVYYGYCTGTIANGTATINLLSFDGSPPPTGNAADGMYEADLFIAIDTASILTGVYLYEGYSTYNINIEGEVTTITFTSFTEYDGSGPSTTPIDLPGSISITPASATVGQLLTANYTPSGGPTSVSYQWKKDGANVGGNSGTYTPTEAGTYTVTVSASGYNSKNSSNSVVVMAIPYRYVITGSGTTFTATRGESGASGVTVGTANQQIQTVIDQIQTDANGQPVDIIFGGNSNASRLDIGTAYVTFKGSWGKITLDGGITSAYTVTDTSAGTITIEGAVDVESMANIANTGASINDSAIYYNGTSDLTISGGTVQAGAGVAVYHANNTGAIYVEGDNTIITSANNNAGLGTIHIAATGGNNQNTRVTIGGGTVKNTASSNNGNTVRNNGQGGILITDGTVETSGTGNAISNSTSGKINITGGTVKTTGTTASGSAVSNSTGTVTISGGTITVGTNRAIIQSGAGTISISGDANITGAPATNNDGTITISAGTLNITGGTVASTAATPRAIALTAAAATLNLGGDPTITGAIHRVVATLGNVTVSGTPQFAPTGGKTYALSFTARPTDNTIAVTGGATFLSNFTSTWTGASLGRTLVVSGADLVVGPGNEGSPIPLTPIGNGEATDSNDKPIPGKWYEGELLSVDQEIWFSFPVVNGKYYTVSWMDEYSGDGNQTAQIIVDVKYQGEDTFTLGTNLDDAVAHPCEIQADRNGTVLVKVTSHPEAEDGTETGTFDIVIVQADSLTGPGNDVYPRPSIRVKR